MPEEHIWQLLCFTSICLNSYLLLQPLIKQKIQSKNKVYMKDKIKNVMEEGEIKGCITSSQRKLVENVLEFKEILAEDVMIHRRDVTMLPLDASHETILETIRKTGLSRFPVYSHNADDVVGILATRKYLLNQTKPNPKPIETVLYPAYFVPKTVLAESLLRDMQNRKTHITIIVDEYGGVDGIVTLEDLLEEIVGNIYDEFDPLAQAEIIQLSPTLWRVSGTADLTEVATTLGFPLPQEDRDFDTIGGLIFNQLDIIPQDGTLPKIHALGLEIQVESMHGRRIQWATILFSPPVPETQT